MLKLRFIFSVNEWLTPQRENRVLSIVKRKSFSFVWLVCSLYSSYSLRFAFGLFSAWLFTTVIYTSHTHMDGLLRPMNWLVRSVLVQMNNTACSTHREREIRQQIYKCKWIHHHQYKRLRNTRKHMHTHTLAGLNRMRAFCVNVFVLIVRPLVWMLKEWLSVQWKCMHWWCICIGEKVSNKQLTDCVVYYIRFFLELFLKMNSL